MLSTMAENQRVSSRSTITPDILGSYHPYWKIFMLCGIILGIYTFYLVTRFIRTKVLTDTYIYTVWRIVRSNSALGHAIWKKSGLSEFVAQMSDAKGNIKYERIIGSFEDPSSRRRWIKLTTNFVAEWTAHVSDPSTRQRYLTTAQFVGNSFLKSQGYPRSVMFDANKPAESISRSVPFRKTFW